MLQCHLQKQKKTKTQFLQCPAAVTRNEVAPLPFVPGGSDVGGAARPLDLPRISLRRSARCGVTVGRGYRLRRAWHGLRAANTLGDPVCSGWQRSPFPLGTLHGQCSGHIRSPMRRWVRSALSPSTWWSITTPCCTTAGGLPGLSTWLKPSTASNSAVTRGSTACSHASCGVCRPSCLGSHLCHCC